MSELFRFTLTRPSELVPDHIIVGPALEGKTLAEIYNEIGDWSDCVDFNQVKSELKCGDKIGLLDELLPSQSPSADVVKDALSTVFQGQDLEEILRQMWSIDEDHLDTALIRLYLLGRDRHGVGPRITRYRQLYDLVRQELLSRQSTHPQQVFCLKHLLFPFSMPITPHSAGEQKFHQKSTGQSESRDLLEDYTEILNVLTSDRLHAYLNIEDDERHPLRLRQSWTRSLTPSAKGRLSKDFPREDVSDFQALHQTAMRFASREERFLRGASSQRTVHTLGSIGLGTNGKRELPWRVGKAEQRDVLPWVPRPVPSSVRPSGVGDLLVVRTHILRYEGGEIVNIQNVIKNERFLREIKNLDRTGTAEVTPKTKETEEERETSSTERYSLNKEASNVIKEDSAFKAGLPVSRKYGPTTEVKADTSVPESGSSDEAIKVATQFAKNITSRAASKVVQKSFRSQVQDFQDNICHEFDNTGDDASNISGIYQWVNKVNQSQIYNYGTRLLFDIVVPEPAAFLVDALAASREIAAKPPEFTASALDINEANYSSLAADYWASGVNAPPPLQQSFAMSFAIEAKECPGPTTFQKDVEIPPGYVAYSATANLNLAFSVERDMENIPVSISIGEMTPGEMKFVIKGEETMWVQQTHAVFSLPFPKDTVGIAVSLWSSLGFSGAVRVNCIRSADGFRQWQQETYDSLLKAYTERVTTYERAIAEAAVASPGTLPGSKPDGAKRLIRNELKKACIAMLTSQNFTVFDGLQADTAHGVVEINSRKAVAQGRYIQFFEQAFEWDQLQYVLYPYYWARKSTWKERLLQTSTDPDFADFVQAGAARVQFGTTPNFGKDVLYFLQTGHIWQGGPVPTLANKDYLPFLNELARAQEQTGIEVPKGKPWETSVPTGLVRLRDEDAQWTWEVNGPKWEKNPLTGYWKEVH